MKAIIFFCFLLTLTIQILWAAEKQKVILDCDLGGDIDDAFAVALVLASPEFDVLGLVMDHGHTPGRAKIACQLLYVTGREEIPVIIGRHTPGVVGKEQSLASESHQFAWAKGFNKIQSSNENAADFIIRNLHKYPNEVILFTVGPVPNMQDVIKKDPDALKLAKKVVSMFGSFYMGYGRNPIPDAEWNVRADVKSAQMFVNSSARLVLAGLDITTFVDLTEVNRMRLLMRQSPLTNALMGLYTLWRYEDYSRPDPTLFDPVAIGMALWPDLFTTRKAYVRVTDEGFTVLDENQPPNCEIGMTIQNEKFLERLMERLLKQNLMRDD
jgi:inosine-uridine nucleoside N-ribohydrolase